MKLIIIGLCAIMASSTLFGQGKGSFAKNKDFVAYLISSKSYEDASNYLEHLIQNDGDLSTDDRQSINYYLGKAYYYQQDLVNSSIYLSQVSSQSEFYYESLFFHSFSNAFLGEYDAAKSELLSFTSDKQLIYQLKYFQLAGIALLERNFDDYKVNSNYFNNEFYQLRKEQDKLSSFYSQLKNYKKKSPVVAGILSAIIPGSGKMYAGQLGEGISTLFKTALVGLPALEAYRKKGVRDARFIIFGSLFSALYIANIWGGVVAVNVTRQEFNNSINDQILVNIHIPLRSIFH